MLIKSNSSAPELTLEQAAQLGIPENVDNLPLQVEHYPGPWQGVKSIKGIALSRTPFDPFSTEPQEMEIYGLRTLSNPKQDGYPMTGRVYVNGERMTAHTSSQLFSIEGRTVKVGILYVHKH